MEFDPINIERKEPTTVKKLIDGIKNDDYILPAIQRKFVWRTEQITKLFDSLMLGYPIGTLLIWKTQSSKNDHFYKFRKDYSEYKDPYNPSVKNTGIVHAILDGQQRMNSLYIGLMGSYTEKIRQRGKKNIPENYLIKQLYINLLKMKDANDTDEIEDNIYEFKFLHEDEDKSKDEVTNDSEHHWFRVGDILDFKSSADINKYLKMYRLDESNDAHNILGRLLDCIVKDSTIHFYMVESTDLDSALNIFIRVNKSGKALKPGDLCLSYLVANPDLNFKMRDRLDEFIDGSRRSEGKRKVQGINNIGGDRNFKFDKDWVLKTFLFLSSDKFSLKTNNFNKNNTDTIKDNLEKYLAAFKKTVELINDFGFNSKHFLSNNSLLPITYYVYRRKYYDDKALTEHGALKEDWKRLKWWFILSNLNELFGSRSDDVLRDLRRVLDENADDKFPLSKMIGIKGEVTVDGIIDSIINYDDKLTVMVLSTFYAPEDTGKHVDHIYPKSKCKTVATLEKLGVTDPSDIEFYMNRYDSIGNLEFLPDDQNKSKSSKLFDKWLEAEFKDKPTARNEFITKHLIPTCDYSFGNFREFPHVPARRQDSRKAREIRGDADYRQEPPFFRDFRNPLGQKSVLHVARLGNQNHLGAHFLRKLGDRPQHPLVRDEEPVRTEIFNSIGNFLDVRNPRLDEALRERLRVPRIQFCEILGVAVRNRRTGALPVVFEQVDDGRIGQAEFRRDVQPSPVPFAQVGPFPVVFQNPVLQKNQRCH